jgi:mannose/fructose/N-acetylgalactosamine-specific phosphotransferase system component IIC
MGMVMPTFDAEMILVILGTATAGGVLGLDRTAVGQFMFSQPIVAGPLVGWMLGDPTSGIVIGAVLELIWVLDMPIGSFVPANATVSTISATAIAALGNNGHADLPVIGFSLILTTGIVPLTMIADSAVRKWNARLWDEPSSGRRGQTSDLLAKAHYLGLMFFYLKSFLLYLLLLPLGIVLVGLFLQFPEYIHRAMAFFVTLLPFLGAALVVRNLSVKTLDIFLLAGFVIAAVAGSLSRSPEFILVLTTLVGLLGAKYREATAR